VPPQIGEARGHSKPLSFLPSVAAKRCAPAPIPVHGTYRHRKRHPSWRAERHNLHSGSTVALYGFVQDGFCNGFPLRDHAAIVLALSHHRNLNIVRTPCSPSPAAIDATFGTGLVMTVNVGGQSMPMRDFVTNFVRDTTTLQPRRGPPRGSPSWRLPARFPRVSGRR
jgi:hypothetical protein